jgi:hypothetical protein
MDEVLSGFGSQRILQAFHQRPFLVVLEKHVVHGAGLSRGRVGQFREKSGLLFSLMVIVSIGPEKPEQRFDIILWRGFTLFHTKRHLVEDVERSQYGFVFTDQEINALHNIPAFLSIETRKADDPAFSPLACTTFWRLS